VESIKALATWSSPLAVQAVFMIRLHEVFKYAANAKPRWFDEERDNEPGTVIGAQLKMAWRWISRTRRSL
jgi:hypothetical protein